MLTELRRSMAKINHNNIVDTINDIANQAKSREVVHLNFNSSHWNGKHLSIAGNDLLNFGTCGYLGLETNPLLINKAIEYTKRYGTQFSISRAYVTSQNNLDLEDKLNQIFEGHKTIVFSSTTLAHIAVLPIVVGVNDTIILDQQAHVSMQTAAQLMAAKSVPIDVIRHNNLEMLERKIQALRDKHDKIWYIIDGVYSMYGDLAPLDELNELAKKYPSLHFYVDDAHGMSWNGKNGCGCVFEKFKDNKKTMLITTMAKGFGSLGGIVVFPNDETYQRVNIHGGPLAYSHPIAPAIIGASIASAEIHLSKEIYNIQNELKDKIAYCNELLNQTDLPILSNPETPIYFVGTGQPNVGYNLNKRILDEGFYVNIGMFPAVAVKNTGLRFTLTNHISKEDIKAFITTLNYHYTKALNEEGKTNNDVRKAFKLPLIEEKISNEINQESKLKLMVYKTITEIDKSVWNTLFYNKGNYDWDSLKMLEEAFSNNTLPEENWKFYYIIIYNIEGEIALASYFTSGIFKDDLLSKAEISNSIEQKRKNNKYYLCSKTLTMGSLFTEGDHLYTNKSLPNWQDAVKGMIKSIFQIQDQEEINTVILRDFNYNDVELALIFKNEGFFKVDMPNTNVINNLQYNKNEELINNLSPRNRRHIKNDVLKYEHLFEIKFLDKLSSDELALAYELYKNVAIKNYSINLFLYPFKLIELLNISTQWEFVILCRDYEIVAIGFCFKSQNNYYPILVGLNYELNNNISVYKQMLYQVVKRAKKLNCNSLYFGFSSDIEKKKLGSVQNEKCAYIELKDNFNFEVINTIQL